MSSAGTGNSRNRSSRALVVPDVNTILGTHGLVVAAIFLVAVGILALAPTEDCGCAEPPAPCSCLPPGRTTHPGPSSGASAAPLSRVAVAF